MKRVVLKEWLDCSVWIICEDRTHLVEQTVHPTIGFQGTDDHSDENLHGVGCLRVIPVAAFGVEVLEIVRGSLHVLLHTKAIFFIVGDDSRSEHGAPLVDIFGKAICLSYAASDQNTRGTTEGKQITHSPNSLSKVMFALRTLSSRSMARRRASSTLMSAMENRSGRNAKNSRGKWIARDSGAKLYGRAVFAFQYI